MSGLICIIDPLQRELFSITNKYLYKQFKFVATLLRRYWFVEVQTGVGRLANVTHGALGTLCLVDLRGQYDSFGCLFQLSRPYSKEEHFDFLIYKSSKPKLEISNISCIDCLLIVLPQQMKAKFTTHLHLLPKFILLLFTKNVSF